MIYRCINIPDMTSLATSVRLQNEIEYFRFRNQNVRERFLQIGHMLRLHRGCWGSTRMALLPVTPKRRWGTPTVASAVMTAHRPVNCDVQK